MSEICFTIGNKFIERQIYLENGVPVRSVLRNLMSGVEWATDGKEPVISLPGIDLSGCEVSFHPDHAICFKGDDFEVCWKFTIWDDLAVIESRIGVKGKARAVPEGEQKDYIDGCGCSSKHVTLTAVQFHDCTDGTDCLVEERPVPLFQHGTAKYSGHVFVLREELSEEECLLVKNAPCEEAHLHKNGADFCKTSLGNMHICEGGIHPLDLMEEEYLYTYPVAVGVSTKGGGIELFRQYYKKDYEKSCPQEMDNKSLYIMSNTWGDRNCDKCVSEAFILQEIKTAAELGCDIVQIDDGWQQGITANSLMASGGVWTGKFRLVDPNFWQVNRAKFPNGFAKIVEAAKEHRVELGLWFSPDSEQDYGDWELDAEVMIDFYHQYGIRYFKIDGVVIKNHTCVKNLLNMFQKVRTASAGQIVFNMDITAGKRFGYLFHREIGDIFVENRYTDWGNYYPHNTLRNLWELSFYFPTKRFQMEVLNHKRNQDKYHDILAPAGYDMDYLFASVMVANPLLWMEMSSLDEESKEKLTQLIRVYKKYRQDFVKVTPIMEKPSGFALTGFLCEGKKANYVILLRELSEEEEFPYVVKEILATNDSQAQAGPVKLTKKRSYLFGILA
ncbi:MAG: alpha-galactosidase [Lachnospiraceae bacterium]|nr:alpha-galactosidase [Lachnospiraceae bacterium]